MIEAIKAINERIELKLQLHRYVEYAGKGFSDSTDNVVRYRHQLIIDELKKDVAKLKRAKELLEQK